MLIHTLTTAHVTTPTPTPTRTHVSSLPLLMSFSVLLCLSPPLLYRYLYLYLYLDPYPNPPASLPLLPKPKPKPNHQPKPDLYLNPKRLQQLSSFAPPLCLLQPLVRYFQCVLLHHYISVYLTLAVTLTTVGAERHCCRYLSPLP